MLTSEYQRCALYKCVLVLFYFIELIAIFKTVDVQVCIYNNLTFLNY